MYFSLCSTTRQILRDAQNDKMIESSYFDTLSSLFAFAYFKIAFTFLRFKLFLRPTLPQLFGKVVQQLPHS
jgi:hypothetical protein